MYQNVWDRADTNAGKKKSVFNILPQSIRKKVEKERFDFDRMQEIRMRTGKPLLFRYAGRERRLSDFSHIVTAEEVNETLQYAANYSLYAYEQEMKQGYLTIEGGHRVGMAGQVIIEGGRVRNLRHVSSVNIRIAHEIKGCGNETIPWLYSDGRLLSTLVIAPPGCGKTTLLRDLIRQISNGTDWSEGQNVGVVDERSELGGSYMGICQNDLGIRTDLLDACPKAEGMMMLVRSMGPQVIAVDEIGSMEEVRMLQYAMCCGCQMIATVHGASYHEIRGKPMFDLFFSEKLFQRYVVMEWGKGVGRIEGIYNEQGVKLC